MLSKTQKVEAHRVLPIGAHHWSWKLPSKIIFPNMVQQYMVNLLLLWFCVSENMMLATTTKNTKLQKLIYGLGFCFCLFVFDQTTPKFKSTSSLI